MCAGRTFPTTCLNPGCRGVPKMKFRTWNKAPEKASLPEPRWPQQSQQFSVLIFAKLQVPILGLWRLQTCSVVTLVPSRLWVINYLLSSPMLRPHLPWKALLLEISSWSAGDFGGAVSVRIENPASNCRRERKSLSNGLFPKVALTPSISFPGLPASLSPEGWSSTAAVCDSSFFFCFFLLCSNALFSVSFSFPSSLPPPLFVLPSSSLWVSLPSLNNQNWKREYWQFRRNFFGKEVSNTYVYMVSRRNITKLFK